MPVKTGPDKRLLRRSVMWFTAALAVTIAVLTLMPLPDMSSHVPGLDKFYHFVAFTALTFPTAFRYPRWRFHMLMAACLFGGAIEVIQPFVGRTASIGDLVADCFGAGLGLVLGRACARRFRARQDRVFPSYRSGR